MFEICKFIGCWNFKYKLYIYMSKNIFSMLTLREKLYLSVNFVMTNLWLSVHLMPSGCQRWLLVWNRYWSFFYCVWSSSKTFTILYLTNLLSTTRSIVLSIVWLLTHSFIILCCTVVTNSWNELNKAWQQKKKHFPGHTKYVIDLLKLQQDIFSCPILTT